MLAAQGHQLFGFSIDIAGNSLYKMAGLEDIFEDESFEDVGDLSALSHAFAQSDPDVVIHLAAQPLVRLSYEDPIRTFQSNVTGTVNLLEVVRKLNPLTPVVIATTDKVYTNHGKSIPFSEDDPLGGWDPYSASKASADIAAQSYIRSYGMDRSAVVRAGNVIGGGDWAEDRLIPDLMRSLAKDSSLKVRFPDAVRPWQHVMDCLNGYLLLAKRLQAGECSGVWNFGPASAENGKTVAEVINLASTTWGSEPNWEVESEEQPHESHFLMLDSSKARLKLGWTDFFDFPRTITETVGFYKRTSEGESERKVLFEQVDDFLKIAELKGS